MHNLTTHNNSKQYIINGKQNKIMINFIMVRMIWIKMIWRKLLLIWVIGRRIISCWLRLRKEIGGRRARVMVRLGIFQLRIRILWAISGRQWLGSRRKIRSLSSSSRMTTATTNTSKHYSSAQNPTKANPPRNQQTNSSVRCISQVPNSPNYHI